MRTKASPYDPPELKKGSPMDPPELHWGQLHFQLVPTSAAAAQPIPNYRVPIKALLRVDEAADILGVSSRQIRNWIDDGTLRGKLINSSLEPDRRHVRVLTESVHEFLTNEERDA